VHYVEFEPGPALRGRARFWRLTGHAPAGVPAEPVLPDGRVELVVHLGDPFTLQRDGRSERQPRVLFAGPGTRPVELAPGGRVDVIGMRLEAGVASALVAEPMAELVDRLPELGAVAPELARGLAEELAEPRRGDDWRAVLERRLVRALERGARPPSAAERAVARLRARGGRLAIGALAQELGRSPRQLEREFRARVGFGPKTFARLVRFQRALSLLARPGTSLAALAARCGYFDQAHLVRDFRQFAGASPSRLRAAEHELTPHFVDP